MAQLARPSRPSYETSSKLSYYDQRTHAIISRELRRRFCLTYVQKKIKINWQLRLVEMEIGPYIVIICRIFLLLSRFFSLKIEFAIWFQFL